MEFEAPAVSKHRVLTLGHKDSDQRDKPAPVEWGREPWFFNLLVDGEPAAVAFFADLNARLDLEAASWR